MREVVPDNELESALADELKRLIEREEQLERQRQSVLDGLEATRRRRELVQALLRDMGYKGAELPQGEPGLQTTARATAPPGPPNPVDIAHKILVARGKKPMHYEELLKEVIDAGGVLGGENPAQTLLARLARDPRFVRPEKRGWYAAQEHYPKARSVGARKSKPAGAKGAKGASRRGGTGKAALKDVSTDGEG